MLKRAEVILIVLPALAALAAVSPKLYQQFTVREDFGIRAGPPGTEATLRMIADHPFLGVGLNNGTAQKRNYVKVSYNRYDPNTQFYLEPTHNLYLSTASEIGIPGALFFLAFFASVTLTAWRQSRQAADPEIRWTANALVVVFCGVAVNGLMDPLQEYSVLVLLWLYAGISLNLPRMAQDHEIVHLRPGRQPRLQQISTAVSV